MVSEKQHFSRQDLLAALEKGWKHYLPQLKELPEEEQARYAQEQGFSCVEDVLVHIFVWWEHSMQRTPLVVSGQSVPPTDVDVFNAEIVERYRQWTREAVEEKFAEVLITFEKFLIEVPEVALENERIQTWLRIDAIEHYNAHHLPNGAVLQGVNDARNE